MDTAFHQLVHSFSGEIHLSEYFRRMYATDASAYREIPKAVAYPKNKNDLLALIHFANQHHIPLIPRAAGTSLAGQVVGKGIVVDISKYFTKILQFDEKAKTITVEVGVIRDKLNQFLASHKLFFSPETSTSNRCTLGGMLGNNSCGLHSLIYGSTRDHLYSVKGFLSDGSEVIFKELTKEEFQEKLKLKSLEGKIYKQIDQWLSNKSTQDKIRNEYPHPSIRRRNTGYALDELFDSNIFSESNQPFNLSKLIAGSEGTLAFITEITLKLSPLPPSHKALILTHHKNLQQAYLANIVALNSNPSAIELMDRSILTLAQNNAHIRKKMTFIKGDPGAVLMIELNAESKEEILQKRKNLLKNLNDDHLFYEDSILWDKEIAKAWEVRRAGLGVLSNMKGERKPVPLIEDMAVRPVDLPKFMLEIDKLLEKHRISCVYYGHIATGELHLRPALNLKSSEDQQLFHQIGKEAAIIAKKYRASLSGEHGDGRLRGEFLPIMYGETISNLFVELKNLWDPKHIFNPGKITNTPPINEALRFEVGQKTPTLKTYFDFSKNDGFISSIEKCNGSGDCRKPASLAKVMCPSYQASLDEKNSTRARANILREYLTKTKDQLNFQQKEIQEVLDLCLSCKGCKTECPSGVDMTKIKAESLQQYYDQNAYVPLNKWLIGNIDKINRLASFIPSIYNFIVSQKTTSLLLKKILHFAPQRTLPQLSRISLKHELLKIQSKNSQYHTTIYFLLDEFTNYYDSEIGVKAIKLLHHLGYQIILSKQNSSGRSLLSMGMLKSAKKVAEKNVQNFSSIISKQTPLIGIEPSTILTFRDEYIDLCEAELKKKAQRLSNNVFLIDEFLYYEMKNGRIQKSQFTEEKKSIKFHGHCHQKALSSTKYTKFILSFPENYQAIEIESGCCGMAGSFGFEKKHYEMSMKIGELKLFPAIRETHKDTCISAIGTSCRHQIKEGTEKEAMHPVEILWEALKK